MEWSVMIWWDNKDRKEVIKMLGRNYEELERKVFFIYGYKAHIHCARQLSD